MENHFFNKNNYFYQKLDERLKQIEVHDKCNFFDSFGILIQFVLFLLTMSVLLYKKYTEKIQRTWITWLLDISKLVMCQGSQHCMNLMMGSILGNADGLECEWYVINLLLDSTVGMYFQYVLLEITLKLISDTNYSFENGNYHDSNGEFSIKKYLYQMFVWLLLVVISKIIYVSFIFIFYQQSKLIGILLLQYFRNSPKLKLIFVMIIFPITFSTIQFWVTDNFIKKKEDEVKVVEIRDGSECEEKKSLV